MAALVFQIVNFALAAVMYTLIGRVLLGLVIGEGSGNFIMRFFVRLTDPVVRLVREVTPRIVPAGVVLLFSIVWVFAARAAAFTLFAAMGAFPGPA